jgi:hypothetical protein
MIEQAWTSLEFLNRFTAIERAAIREEAKTDPVTADWLQMASAAQEILNTDAATIQGMDYLVGAGLLTQERADAIMGV